MNDLASKKAPRKPFTIRLPEELDRRLNDYITEENLAKNDVVVAAIARFLDRRLA